MIIDVNDFADMIRIPLATPPYQEMIR